MIIYLVGSLRNPEIPTIGNKLRTLGHEVFDDWHAAGPHADDEWKRYETERGRTYAQALDGYAAKHVFSFDYHHLNRCDGGVLVLPAGRSGHLEIGYLIGKGKPGYILFADDKPKLPDTWKWIAGLYEGEGSVTVNNTKTQRNLQLSISSTDKDVVEKVHTLSGVGNLQGPYFRKNANLKKQPSTIKPMYRWSVYKKDDILFVLKGMLENLCSRRTQQILDLIKKMRWEEEFLKTEGPYEYRYDVMYQFATKVFFSQEEMYKELKNV